MSPAKKITKIKVKDAEEIQDEQSGSAVKKAAKTVKKSSRPKAKSTSIKKVAGKKKSEPVKVSVDPKAELKPEIETKPEPRKINVINEDEAEIKDQPENKEAEEEMDSQMLNPLSIKSRSLARTKKIAQTEVERALSSDRSVVKDLVKSETKQGTANSEETHPAAVDQARPQDGPEAVKAVPLARTADQESTAPAVPIRRSVGLYRKIAISFMVLTLVLVAVIFYFTFVSVTIILVPNQERISNNMIFTVSGADSGTAGTDAAIIPGTVEQIQISHEGTYPATGEEIIGQEAVGEVTIINSYTKNQPLVATTRLLSSDGKLFRLKTTVNVPAGGSAQALIYADEPSPEMAIGPSKFTIPGLWAGLQDKIYAESANDIVYQQKVKKHIAAEDIENAVRDMKQTLLALVQQEVSDAYKDYSQTKYKIDENSIISQVSGKAGDEVEDFPVSMKANVVVVAFDGEAAANMTRQKFLSALPSNKELISFDDANIIYSLNSFDYVEGEATMNATFEGKVSLKDNTEIVDLDAIKGLNASQLDLYLSDLKEIAGYEIRFSPSFLPGFLKRVPRLVDRIKVEIKK